MPSDPSPPLAAWRQLPLPFAHAPHYAGADFLPAPSNAAALAWLDRTGGWPQGRLVLFGEAGSGKTHLLHRWARRQSAAMLSGLDRNAPLAPPACPLAVDDADAASERTLLHLLNFAQEAGHPVLLAARTPPSRWGTSLPDLASRLRAAAAVEIGAADEGLLRALLARLLAERQLVVPEPVQDWLLLRLPRSPEAVREAAARLDRYALAAGGPVTRRIAASVLAGFGETVDEDCASASSDTSSAVGRLL